MADDGNYWVSQRRARFTRRRVLTGAGAASAALASLALVGCGDDDDDDDDDGGAAPEAVKGDSTGISDSEVKVGILLSKSGVSGTQWLPYPLGVKARFDMENEKGGVNGRKLVTEEGDDGSDVNRNFSAAKDLIDNKKVFGLLAVSSFMAGSAQYLSEKSIPVTGWPITPEWGKFNNMFGYHGGTPSIDEGGATTTTAKFLKERGVTNLGVVTASTPQAALAGKNAAKGAGKVGLKVGYIRTDIPTGSTDFTADVQKMKEAGVDGLTTAMIVQQNVALYQACVQGGINFKGVVFPTGYDERVLAALGKQLEGVYFQVDFTPFERNLPAHKTFLDGLKKVAPDQKPDQISMAGWISADLFIRGLTEAGKQPTREGYVQNLRKVSGYTADGLLAPVDYGKAFGKPLLCGNMVQVKDSKFVPVGDGPICGELVG